MINLIKAIIAIIVITAGYLFGFAVSAFLVVLNVAAVIVAAPFLILLTILGVKKNGHRTLADSPDH